MVGWQDGSLAAYAYLSGERLNQIVVLRHNLAGSLPITSVVGQEHRGVTLVTPQRNLGETSADYSPVREPKDRRSDHPKWSSST